MPIFDLVLALTVVWLGYHTVSRRDLFKSVVLFITYGVLLSLVWVRLRAFDLALVEVAIGAGITGALFLNTLGRIRQRDTPPASGPGDGEGKPAQTPTDIESGDGGGKR